MSNNQASITVVETNRYPVRPVVMKPSVQTSDGLVSNSENNEDDHGNAIPETQTIQASDQNDSNDHDENVNVGRALSTANPTAEPTVKKVAKQISVTAHANFRKLKIKNKNSKASGRGRFGGRR